MEESGEPSTPIAPKVSSVLPSPSRAALDPASPTMPSFSPPIGSAPQPVATDSSSLERLTDMILARVSAGIRTLFERVEGVQTQMRSISKRLTVVE